MNQKAINSLLDIAPEYVDFLIKFLRCPPEAIRKLSDNGVVSKDLSSILLGGVALVYFMVILAGSEHLQSGNSAVTQWVQKLAAIDILLLPATVLLGVLGFAILGHLLGKGFVYVSSIGGRFNPSLAKLGGSMEDTVNAALGLSSVYLPMVAAVVCLKTRLPQYLVETVGLALAVLLGVFPCIYYPWSLSGTHPETSGMQAFFALCGGAFPVLLIMLSFNSTTATP